MRTENKEVLMLDAPGKAMNFVDHGAATSGTDANFVRVAQALNQHSKAISGLRESFDQLARSLNALHERVENGTGSSVIDRLAQAAAALREQLMKLDASSASNFELLSKTLAAANEKLARFGGEMAEVRPRITAMKVHAESLPGALRAARRADAEIDDLLCALEARLREVETQVLPQRAPDGKFEEAQKKRAARRDALDQEMPALGGKARFGSIAPYVQVIDDVEMREAPRESLNRLCNLSDWRPTGELAEMMKRLAEPHTVHRKAWEYALCVHGLEKLGAVREDGQALAVGAGYERPLFYFANRIRRMVATDLYNNPNGEGSPEMLKSPEKFAPFAYRKSHLEVLQMSGDDLKFPDHHFDFIFSLSSIEHFGGRAKQRKSLEEMRRVLKPGGIIALATELILNQATHPEYFTLPELETTLLHCPGLELAGGALDLRIEQSLIEYPVMMDETRHPAASPHIVLFSGGVLWTSVMMFLQKGR